jgi:hypothetical protein
MMPPRGHRTEVGGCKFPDLCAFLFPSKAGNLLLLNDF